MSRLKIVIDLGSSATKVVYTWGDRPLKQFLMSPFCIKVPPSYPQKRSWGEAVDHLEASWITIGDECALLGTEARKHYGSGITNQERKKAKALFKCLGILAAIQLEHGEAESIPIDLGVLLPFEEYLTREALIEGLLQSSQASLSFCEMPVKLSINDVTVMPEGAGLFSYGVPSKQKGRFSHVAVAVLVIGHRNLSWLVLQEGKPIPRESKTNLLGFRWLVEEVRILTGYNDELGLAKMIFLGEGLEPELKEAISSCLPLYWQGIESFISSQRDVDYVVCGGGAATIFKEPIKKYFGRKVGWATGLTKELKSLGVKESIDRIRLADAYGMLKTL